MASNGVAPDLLSPPSGERTPAGAGPTPRSTAHEHDILTTAEGSNRLGTFVDFMRAAGLSSLLLGDGPYTVFAPTDRAFGKLTLGARDALLADRERLGRVMRGHIVPGRVGTPGGDAPAPVTTIDGATLFITFNAGSYHVSHARLVQTSIPASNGVLHAIDAVLLAN
jgi:uncharacterized surface protein with fasciclin (FAS1) repeats